MREMRPVVGSWFATDFWTGCLLCVSLHCRHLPFMGNTNNLSLGRDETEGQSMAL